MSKHINQNENVTAMNTSVLNNVATMLIKKQKLLQAQRETDGNSSGRLLHFSPVHIRSNDKK